MNYFEIMGAIALIIGIVSYIPYLISIKKGQTKPHAFSWLIWGLLTAIAFFAQMTAGAGAGAWVTGFTAAISFIIVGFALFKGEKNITRSDWITFIAALAAIPLWYFTKNPLYAVVLITVIDALAFYPTFRKSWHKPHEENAFTFTLSAFKFFFATLGLEEFTVTTSLYPLSLVLMNGLFVAMIMWRRKVLNYAPY